jgi:hypothetical protein
MYKIRGKIKSVEAVNLNTQKGDFVKKLITIEELDTGFNHIQQFEIFGQESIDVIEGDQKLAEELIVNINFYIRSNEFKGRFYNTLMVKELRVENTYVKETNEPPF